jgi:hypothetical protein
MMMSRRQSTFSSLSAILLSSMLVAGLGLAQDEKSDSTPEKEATEEAQEAPVNDGLPATGPEMAESLRQPGQVVSQSGDLKIAVDPQYFAEFPGYNLDHLTSGQHAWLLKQANTIYCTCGCRGDTVGRCVVTDPTCQTARKMLDKLNTTAGKLTEEELKAAAAAEKEAAPPPPAR